MSRRDVCRWKLSWNETLLRVECGLKGSADWAVRSADWCLQLTVSRARRSRPVTVHCTRCSRDIVDELWRRPARHSRHCWWLSALLPTHDRPHRTSVSVSTSQSTDNWSNKDSSNKIIKMQRVGLRVWDVTPPGGTRMVYGRRPARLYSQAVFCRRSW